MEAYSQDLRERVLAALAAGMTYDQASATFQVSRATVGRWRRRQRETGACVPRTSPGRPARLGAALDADLVAQVRADPAATQAEHAARWTAAHPDLAASARSISRALARAEWTRTNRR